MSRQDSMSQPLLREFFIFMGWKIVEIENANRLRLFLDNLVIYKEEDTLIIDNVQINLSIQLINKLSENNVNVIICDQKHLPSAQLLPIIGNYNALKVLNKQLEWNHQYKSNLWKKLIIQKIDNQIEILSFFGYYNDNIKVMNDLKNEVKEYDITNREGHAAKIYWHTLFGIEFNRRDEENPINKYLNYGYAILRSYFSKSIVKKGLDPRISIFHKSFHNHFALASDLMEVFRIIVDFEKMQKPWYESKQQLIELFNRRILVDGKEQFINNAIDLFLEAIIAERELPNLVFPMYEWN